MQQGAQSQVAVSSYGVFTLPDTNTDTETDTITTVPNRNLWWCLSLCSMNTSTQFYNPFYRPQMKVRKGNVFTSVCQEFCPHWVYPSMHWGRHPSWSDTPWSDTPWSDTPPGQTLPSDQTAPLVRHPPDCPCSILLECILVYQCRLAALGVI